MQYIFIKSIDTVKRMRIILYINTTEAVMKQRNDLDPLNTIDTFDSRQESSGYADYISDAVFFLLCVSAAIGICYLLVPLFQPDAWWKL